MKAIVGLMFFSFVAIISYLLLTITTEWDETIKLLLAIVLGALVEIFFYRRKMN